MTDPINNKAVAPAGNNQHAESKHSSTSELNNIDALSQYLKSEAGTRQGRAIPPLEKWHPEQIADMDLIIKANGEWWHEGQQVTRDSLINLFATVLCVEEKDGVSAYFLKTPVQKLRIQVEDAPLLINDVGILTENNLKWLEFTTTTGDVVRLDDMHPIILRNYQPSQVGIHEMLDIALEQQVRPYMLVRDGLIALIGRNTFYHLIEIGDLSTQDDNTILTLKSGGQIYHVAMPKVRATQ